MAINYASKFDKKVVERFTLKSLTDAAVNKDYEWSGVSTVTAYSYPTTALSDYTLTGADRYGVPAEQQNTKQDMTVAKDRSATITVDRKTLDDTNTTAQGNKILSRQINEIWIPEVDAYRIAAMATAAVANLATATVAVTASNAYENFLKATEWFGNKKIPMQKRVAFCSYAFYSFIKQDPAFMLASDVAMNEKINGMVGMIDGVKLVPVPSTYLPANTAFVMCHPSVTVGVTKLEDYKIHDNPPGISGIQIDMRFRYDAFVLDAKKDGLYSHKIA
jgi:N4-gp56 family major capsid protein